VTRPIALHSILLYLFKVEGMTCTSCVNKIENSMRKLAGVISVHVVLLTNRGRIEYDPSIIGPRDILQYMTVSSLSTAIRSS
jgi:copper chaperone CopZ